MSAFFDIVLLAPTLYWSNPWEAFWRKLAEKRKAK